MANFQLKYHIKILVIYPFLGFFFIRAFDRFTRLILHIYANQEVIWNGFVTLSNSYWIAMLWLVHLATTLLVSMVLMTLTNRNRSTIIFFASIISFHSLFKWLHLIQAQKYSIEVILSLENVWSSDLLPVLIHTIIGIVGCFLSYRLSKTSRTAEVKKI
ncbi:MAG: hypothetical protein CL672_05060 [Balneola sp.]|nr:hypothetical protein [Balneola sp.]|tara:strand:+ start:8120 stop:8596 length:477 start_codon:yes stop_codon:yes gene_type:complete